MNIAILHYHLNRGGVTRVIENQLLALDAVLDPGEPWRVALLFGGRRQGWDEDLPKKLHAVELTLHEVPLLDYDDQIEAAAGDAPSALAGQLAGLLADIGFQPLQSVLHAHNHALGKNVALPECLRQLAGEGYPLLLQIHDFAEDLRPANYRRFCEGYPGRTGAEVAALLYPQAPHIHYAVLNGRDEHILEAAGAAAGQVHRLPNPVPETADLHGRPAARGRLAERFAIAADQRYVLYPVRCIRRKNVGEALLHAALAPPECVIGLTLPPLNPVEVPIYQGWKQLAEELRLPCRFEVGGPGGLSLAENFAAADLILTTSLAEGFGMVFLESWLASRPLCGRDLPEITRDLTEFGLRFDWLSPRLDVPIEWVGVDAFRQSILEAYGRTLQAYGRDVPKHLAEQLEARTRDGLVDFGDLDETLQQQVIRIVCRSETDRRRLLRQNPWIEAALAVCDDVRNGQSAAEGGIIQQNAQAVREHFSRQPSGRRLLDLYRRVAGSRRGQHLAGLPHGGRILDEFLAFSRFRPIRS